MTDGAWLTKSEVNSLYYNTVAGEIAFSTDARWGGHPLAVANLVVQQSAVLGKRQIRILEIGANDCIFAHALVSELRRLGADGVSELDRVDYLAVEFARGSLEAAADWVQENGFGTQVRRGPRVASSPGPPEKPAMVALITGAGAPSVNLGLVHAEALQFVRTTNERFDFVILNELLDDLPSRAFYADGSGRRFEALSESRGGSDGNWQVRIRPQAASATAAEELPAGRMTSHSPESVELVDGIAGLLVPGGALVIHDYGFAEPHVSLDNYSGLQPQMPWFVSLEFPPGSESGFPRGFYRVFGNEHRRVVQVTNDVNFAELAAVLEPRGAATILPHGSKILNAGGTLKRGDGVFLSELGMFEPGADLAELLAELHERQAEFRGRFVRDHMEGRESMFLDLVFLKDTEPTGT